ncbi:hypothetical protein [Harryflintia acetispora]|uniref:hypothetical protein n=1 Tax=Harryflintia acetispora TaxID=1849041 RepID=UPI00189B4CB2|nr:hypothetical protein [Harryflintia acetispora]
MILVISIIKILLFLAISVGTYLWFLHNVERSKMIGFSLAAIAFSIIAGCITAAIPSLTDKVTLTAMGTGREEAENVEVVLNGYIVDGKIYSALESLEIVDGRWFWSGEQYCWRAETDTRQPEGRTRFITIKVPVGYERFLNFQGHVYRGKVKINTEAEEWVVDTYAEPPCILPVSIGRSSYKALILNYGFHLSIYAGILFLLMKATTILLKSKLELGITQNIGKLFYVAIALISFILMVYYVDRVPLWSDELLQAESASYGLKASLQRCLQMRDATPPLYSICAALWYRIAPFGERWLLLISMVPTAISVYLLGSAGEK